jgi:predicted nuclease of predicted toxin-antitoxin system
VRVLLDSCVSGGVKVRLQAAGHDVIWANDWPKDPGDEEILAAAASEERILVTLDKDFGELAIVHGRPHAGILRLVNLSTAMQASVSARVLADHGERLSAGAIITAEATRLRIREVQ